MIMLSALLVGMVAGLRTFTAPACIAWAARLGWLPLHDTGLAFLGSAWAPWLFTVLALAEDVIDQRPSTPSRKVPMQFGARIVSGAFCGAAVGLWGESWITGLIAGAVGAVVGTLGGAEVRSAMARAFRRDLPAALIEDAAAIILGLVIIRTI